MLILGSNQVLLLYVLDCVFTLGNVVRDLVQRGGRLALAAFGNLQVKVCAPVFSTWRWVMKIGMLHIT